MPLVGISEQNWKKIMNWQPIATAPKDGTRVLLYFPTLREPVQFGWFADSKTISHGRVTSEWQKWMIEGQLISLRPLTAEADPEPEMWAPVTLPEDGR